MIRDNPRTPSVLPFVVVAALLARLAAMLPSSGRFDDPDNYLPLAASLAAGEGLTQHGRPTAYRPPLYPLALAPLILVAPSRRSLEVEIALLHLALGAGTACCTALAARRLGASDRRTLVAGLIAALDPVLVWQSRHVMTETPTAFLIAATLATATGGGPYAAPGAGLLLGLASLCRPSILPGAVLAVLAALLAPPGRRAERLGRGLGLAATVVLVLAPWAIRNRLMLGEFVWTTTHGGYTLALANNEVYYRDVLDGPSGSVWTGPAQKEWWESVNRRTAGMPEPTADRFLRDEAVDLARRRPATFARACLARLATLWSPSPAAGVYSARVRGVTLAWSLPVLAAFVMGLASPQFRRWPGVVAPCLILGLTIVHAFYWTDLRMRAPIVPAIALAACFAGFPLRRRTGSAQTSAGG